MAPTFNQLRGLHCLSRQQADRDNPITHNAHQKTKCWCHRGLFWFSSLDAPINKVVAMTAEPMDNKSEEN